jgi:hypothetical protein
MANTARKALKNGAIDPSKALPVVFRIGFDPIDPDTFSRLGL